MQTDQVFFPCPLVPDQGQGRGLGPTCFPVRQALRLDSIMIVNYDWLRDSLLGKRPKREKAYLLQTVEREKRREDKLEKRAKSEGACGGLDPAGLKLRGLQRRRLIWHATLGCLVCPARFGGCDIQHRDAFGCADVDPTTSRAAVQGQLSQRRGRDVFK